MNENTNSIFDPPPPPEHMVAEARMLAISIYTYSRSHLKHREGTQPYDSKHHYGFHDMSKPLPDYPDKELWIQAIIEYMQRRAKGMF